MCYYNGVKVTRNEFIRLKSLEKLVANYDFLSKPLHIGFNYGNKPVLKRTSGVTDFDIVEMEWGFLPPYLRDRESAEKFRKGYVKSNGEFQQPILTLNAMEKNCCCPVKCTEMRR